MAPSDRVPFTIIGENVHATRSYARQGKNMVSVAGEERLGFRDVSGAQRTCPIAAPVAASTEFAKNKVKHIRNALLLGLGGDGVLGKEKTGEVSAEGATDARDYLVAAAVRQQLAGAHYIDVNVDEIDPTGRPRGRARRPARAGRPRASARSPRPRRGGAPPRGSCRPCPAGTAAPSAPGPRRPGAAAGRRCCGPRW